MPSQIMNQEALMKGIVGNHVLEESFRRIRMKWIVVRGSLLLGLTSSCGIFQHAAQEFVHQAGAIVHVQYRNRKFQFVMIDLVDLRCVGGWNFRGIRHPSQEMWKKVFLRRTFFPRFHASSAQKVLVTLILDPRQPFVILTISQHHMKLKGPVLLQNLP
jgi:hypothetical protein